MFWHHTTPHHNSIVQAEAIAWQECSMSSLVPHFLQTVQQALHSSLVELDYAPVKFCNAWSVLMFALACVDPVTTNAATRSGNNVMLLKGMLVVICSMTARCQTHVC